MTAPQFKQLRRAYGFDEVALVPGDTTINPDQTNVDFKVEGLTFSIPIMAAAMDAVTDVNFATLMGKMGGLAVLNLDGVQTRYDNPQEILSQITQAGGGSIHTFLRGLASGVINHQGLILIHSSVLDPGQEVLFQSSD